MVGEVGAAMQGSFELPLHLGHVVVHGGVVQHGIGREMSGANQAKGTSKQQYRCENGHVAIQVDKCGRLLLMRASGLAGARRLLWYRPHHCTAGQGYFSG